MLQQRTTLLCGATVYFMTKRTLMTTVFRLSTCCSRFSWRWTSALALLSTSWMLRGGFPRPCPCPSTFTFTLTSTSSFISAASADEELLPPFLPPRPPPPAFFVFAPSSPSLSVLPSGGSITTSWRMLSPSSASRKSCGCGRRKSCC